MKDLVEMIYVFNNILNIYLLLWSICPSLRVRSRLEMEALGSQGGERHDWTQSLVKGPESGESTGSRVHTQKAREGLGGGDRGGEATLGSKADTCHPLGPGCLRPPGVRYAARYEGTKLK